LQANLVVDALMCHMWTALICMFVFCSRKKRWSITFCVQMKPMLSRTCRSLLRKRF